MIIKTSDTTSIKPFLKSLYIPRPDSHKGQNGRVLVIGGSTLFHSASIWAAQVASHFVDIVHYSSTLENEEVFLSLKKKFHNGIIVPQKDLEHYINEDDAILVGPGMMRDGAEAKYTYMLTRDLIEKHSNKKFVFDAGSLQMMEKEWLLRLKQMPILTPHQQEFERLFGEPIQKKSEEEKVNIVKNTAKKYNALILLKAVVDIISDGDKTYIVKGGNAGLTKGGTGDVLAGLSVSLYARNNSVLSAILSSYLLKKSSDELFQKKGYWYNIDDIINQIPLTLNQLVQS